MKNPKRVYAENLPLREKKEKSALESFIRSCERSQSYISSNAEEAESILSYVNKCKRRLKEIRKIEAANRLTEANNRNKASAEVDTWVKCDDEKRTAQIKATHKKSGFSPWVHKLHGSAFKPK